VFNGFITNDGDSLYRLATFLLWPRSLEQAGCKQPIWQSQKTHRQRRFGINVSELHYLAVARRICDFSQHRSSDEHTFAESFEVAEELD